MASVLPLLDHSELVLLGTVHRDEQGFARTLRFLDSFQPDVMFVELSPYAKAYRDRNQSTLQCALNHNLRVAARKCGLPFTEALTHPEIKVLRRQLSLPLEYRAARRYSRATGGLLMLVDYSPFSRRMIAMWPELLGNENLAALLALSRDSRPKVTMLYDLAARAIRGEGFSLAGMIESSDEDPDHLWEKRERHLADSIRSLLSHHRPSRAVYLGGWLHLSSGGRFPSLRELLKISLSQCALLDRGFL